MPTRPVQGGSNGTWGTELNAWLDAAITPYNVKADYAAKGDGVTDDTTAIQNAITACSSGGGGVVFFPPGTYLVSSTLSIPHRVFLKGSGADGPRDVPWNPASLIKWSGAAHGTMLNVSATQSKIGISELSFDGNSSADYCLYLDGVVSSVFENIGIQNCQVDLITVTTSSGVSNNNCQQNRFASIFLHTGTPNTGSGIHLSGNAGGSLGTANACHNVFEKIFVEYWNNGIVLDDCDNNTFIGVYLFRATGTGVAVALNTNARANYFYHLQANGGISAANTSGFVNTIYGLDESNGAITITRASGANLLIVDQPPACRVYHNVDQSTTSSVTATLAFNSERFDTEAIHDTVTNNSRLTCKTAGKYLITANVDIAPSATGERAVTLQVNGGTVIGQVRQNPDSTASANTAICVSTVYDMAVNDYVEVLVYQTSGGALNVLSLGNYSPEFSMVRVA